LVFVVEGIDALPTEDIVQVIRENSFDQTVRAVDVGDHVRNAHGLLTKSQRWLGGLLGLICSIEKAHFSEKILVRGFLSSISIEQSEVICQRF
jgi:hypothetical protein